MRGKLALLVGVGVGYVLGAKAGREKYEEIKRTASRLWNDPRVQHQVQNVEDFAKDKAPEVVDFLSDSAKKVVRKNQTSSGTSGATGTSETGSTADTGGTSAGSTGNQSG